MQPEQPTTPTQPAVPTPAETSVATDSATQPATPKYVEVEGQKELPNTGTEANTSLAALGFLGALSGFGFLARKKKED
ncbi:LPXTG cell wall anchor domain-containing protein [Streptococcus sp. 5346]|uniref:LPXTG cell wall anchor domain-containing protein n=1 Tax=Streptococcus sp. 5346 TaxID=2582636 RepID=UPI0031F5B0E3